MNYVATFYTHYGAMRFNKYCKESGLPSKMAAVPRELSASCGTCVRFEAAAAPVVDEHEDMEHCYAVTESGTYALQEG